MVANSKSKFSLGTIVGTPACLELLEKHGVLPSSLLARHASGDWGVVDSEDAKLNDLALQDGSRILSAYEIGSEKVWIITEWDRSVSTLLLPSEY